MISINQNAWEMENEAKPYLQADTANIHLKPV